MEDDYTLLSSKEVSELKQDVDYLKKNPLGGTKSGKSLQESIDKLNENMELLIEIFKEASDQVKAEERESDVIVKRIEPMEHKLEELSDQNQKIAKGILAVADMVSEYQQKQRQIPPQRIQPMPQRPVQPMPQMAQQQKMSLPPIGNITPQTVQAPRPMPQGMPLPPMPPKKEEKKGLFG